MLVIVLPYPGVGGNVSYSLSLRPCALKERVNVSNVLPAPVPLGVVNVSNVPVYGPWAGVCEVCVVEGKR